MKVEHPAMHYMLRKTLIPWRVDETIAEVLAYCKANCVDEVIWMIDVETFYTGFTTLDTIRESLPGLTDAKRQFDSVGIITSINPWITLNHGDYGRNSRAAFPDMQWMVDYSGIEAKACACPLSPVWQKHIVDAYSLYAQVQPDILWVEDDFRHFNHTPVEWGCFCPVHMEAFSKIAGEKTSREGLVDRLLQPGKPHSRRAQWLDFLGQNMVDVAVKLQKAVSAVSPDTQLGLMSSGPEYHSLEGRKWKPLLAALSGGRAPMLRPNTPPYRETTTRDAYDCLAVLRRTLACVPRDTIACSEVENYTFTQFVKSIRLTQTQILLNAILGHTNNTLNLYDHCGSPLPPGEPYGLMLRETKEQWSGLFQYCQPGGRVKGVQLLFSTEIAKNIHTRGGENYLELCANCCGWSEALEALGHSVTYEPGGVTAVTGQMIRGLNEKDLEQILSKGVLLDASAAKTLHEDGFGDLIGVDLSDTLSTINDPVSAEEFGVGLFITARLALHSDRFTRMKPHTGAEVINNLVDGNRQVLMPAWVRYQNTLGGRVAIYAGELEEGTLPGFLSWYRKTQLKEVIRWLNNGHLDCFVSGGAYSLPLRTDYENHSTVAVLNSSLDPWPEITLECFTSGRAVREVLMYDGQGAWRPAPLREKQFENETLRFVADKELHYLDLAVFALIYDKD